MCSYSSNTTCLHSIVFMPLLISMAICIYVYVYLIVVVTQPDMYTRARRGVDISGKAQVAVSQLLCYTSSDTAVLISPCIDFDCGL